MYTRNSTPILHVNTDNNLKKVNKLDATIMSNLNTVRQTHLFLKVSVLSRDLLLDAILLSTITNTRMSPL